MFATSRQLGRIPVIAFAGAPGSGKTTFLNRLLQLPELARTVVLTTEGENKAGFDHDRVLFLPAKDFVSESGCLCCDMRSALGDTLRNLFLNALAKKIPPIDRVIIETPALDPSQLKFTLRHAPFLGQRYIYRGTFLVLDISRIVKEGIAQEDQDAIRYADTVIMTKMDLVEVSDRLRVQETLQVLHPGLKLVTAEDVSQVLIPAT